jgi:glycosyltransferase involved in cell wall biosynthesis
VLAPSLSILMPAFNGGDYVLAAVASAVAQLAEGDELLVQDGGSRDGSVERLREIYRDDPRVKMVSEPDAGQSDALATALGRARNPVIGWLNADDVYYPGALDAVRAAWEKTPSADVVYGGSTLFGDAGGGPDAVIRTLRPAGFTRMSFLRHGCHVFSGSTFLRAESVRAAGGFDVGLHYCMDYDLFLRLAAGNPVTVRVPEVIGGLRWHDASKSSSVGFRFIGEALRVQQRHTRGLGERLVGRLFIARYALTVASTPVRHSRWYSRLRPRKDF